MRAKKSLGQNFLISSAPAADLVDAADIKNVDTVVEIGPGKGIITEILLGKARHVIAIEKDDGLIEFLKQKFSKEIFSGKLILVHDDILNFNPSFYILHSTFYKLIGSIPYYITGKFLKYFLQETRGAPAFIALIIQKEVAERIVAKDGKESILSISVKAYGIPHYTKTISRKLFSPEPGVDSAILIIDSISKKLFSEFTEKEFFTLVKAGFKSKRKLLAGNLKRELPRNFSKEKISHIFQKLGISPNARAENLSLEQWRLLCLESAPPRTTK